MEYPVLPSSAEFKIFEALPDLYVLLSPDLTIITASNSYLSNAHITRTDIAGKSFWDTLSVFTSICQGISIPRLKRSLQTILGFKRPHYSQPDTRIIIHESADPSTHYWCAIYTPVLDEQGEINYIVLKIEKVRRPHRQQHNLKPEQQAGKKKLQYQADLLQSVFDTSLVGISVYKAVRNEKGSVKDFTIKFANKEMKRIVDRTDLEDSLYTIEFPEARRTGLYTKMLQAMATEEPTLFEYSYNHKGKQKWLSNMFVKLDDGLVATTLDQTKRKLAEKERLKSFTLLQQSEELASMGSWEYDLHTEDFTWSDGMYRLFDLPKGTLVKPDIYLQYVTDKCAQDTRRMVSYLKQGSQDFDETIEINVTGNVKIIRIRARVAYSDHGEPMRVLGVDLDITAAKHAEQLLLEDAAMIQGIADAAPDMLYVINISTMQKVYANYKIVQLLQKTVEEMKALGPALFEQYVHPDDLDNFKSNLEAFHNTDNEEAKEITYRLIDYKGNIHWIRARRTIYKRDEQGRPTHIVGVSQDVSEQMELREKNQQLWKERKEIEERQQQEILRAILIAQEEERKRIAESIHNGLGQILYGVKLSLNQINMEKLERLKDNQTYYQQTDQLLMTAIKESRRISHELTPAILEDFGLQEALNDICKQLGVSVKIKCEFTGANYRLEPYLDTAIYRIVQELLMNIIKHANATEGKLKVKISKSRIHISVQDNGNGFSETTSKGIGLKTIRNKIKLLNGKLQISSAAGEGTTVTIDIPYITLKA